MDLYEPVKLFTIVFKIVFYDCFLTIVFKIWEYFCPFLIFSDPYWPTKLFSLADGLLGRIPETNDGFGHFFHCEIWKLSFLLLQVAESNQAKASLPKQWLATEEANRSLVVREQFARFSRLRLVFILVLWSFLAKFSRD